MLKLVNQGSCADVMGSPVCL